MPGSSERCTSTPPRPERPPFMITRPSMISCSSIASRCFISYAITFSAAASSPASGAREPGSGGRPSWSSMPWVMRIARGRNSGSRYSTHRCGGSSTCASPSMMYSARSPAAGFVSAAFEVATGAPPYLVRSRLSTSTLRPRTHDSGRFATRTETLLAKALEEKGKESLAACKERDLIQASHISLR